MKKIKELIEKSVFFCFWCIVSVIVLHAFVFFPLCANVVTQTNINEKFCLASGDKEACRKYYDMKTSKIYYFSRDYISFLEKPLF